MSRRAYFYGYEAQLKNGVLQSLSGNVHVADDSRTFVYYFPKKEKSEDSGGCREFVSFNFDSISLFLSPEQVKDVFLKTLRVLPREITAQILDQHANDEMALECQRFEDSLPPDVV